MLNVAPARACALGFALALASLAPRAQSASAATGVAGARLVLPTAVTPDRYRIEFTPDAQTLTFRGSVAIDLTVHEPTRRIVLNSAELVIDRVSLTGIADAPAIRYDERQQRLSVILAHAIQPGTYTLSLEYHGKIRRQPAALFALDYDTPSGKGRALFTQFENTDARRFVPCWDEPGIKASFELTARVPAGQMAVSNMPIDSEQALPDDFKRVHFAVTPKMPPYLLFFGLGDFERVHRAVDGVDVGVIVKRGDTASAAFALDAASELLPYYNDYFGTRYALPKLDLIAGPGSSDTFGAMENWGAIFCFENEMLIESRVATERNRLRVYQVLAHEMAHQWFGDLVTMAWWDDVLLNEGFATWMEAKATDHFHPEWKVWLQDMRERQDAMQEDARDGTHPIVTRITDALQADSAFDHITYAKGEQLIRTLEAYLGETAFREGVRRYLHDHAYGNAVTDEFWSELDRDSVRPISPIAHDLTRQAGVPMIGERSAVCADQSTTVELTQTHFAIDADSTAARLWHVPLLASTLGGATVTAMVAGAAPAPIHLPGCGAVLLNVGQTAYLRAHYSAAGLAALMARFAELSAADQLGILYDTVSLAAVGEYPMAALMNLLSSVAADADPALSGALVAVLQDLDISYQGLPSQAAFRTFARGLAEPLFARVGWDATPGEHPDIALLRTDLAQALAELEDAAALAEARRRYQRYLADPSSLDAAARDTVLEVVALRADQSTWNQLHQLAHSARTEVERLQLYIWMARALDPALAQQALDLTLSGDPPPSFVPRMISQTATHHPALAFHFVISHWEQIAALLEPHEQGFFVPQLLHNASDPRLIDELNRFASAHIPPEAMQSMRREEAGVRDRSRIRRIRLPELDRWLETHRD